MAQYKSPLFLPHTGCLLAQLWWHTQERDRCELTILLQRRTCQAGRMSQERSHMAGTEAFHGASRKAASQSCVGGFLPRVLQCPAGTVLSGPRCTGTCHAERSCCPPLHKFCVFSSAPAHAPTANAHSKQPTQGSCNPRLPAHPTLHPVPGLHLRAPRHRLC